MKDMWTPPVKPKYAIEGLFPSRWVSLIADKESKAKPHYRPVLMMHKWWARRLGVVFRTILKLLLHNNASIPALETQFQSFEGFREWYLEDIDAGGKRLLDPFMGGGTTLVEGRRLHFDLVGCDLNPVAWFVVKKELEPLDLDAFEREYCRIRDAVSSLLLSYHKTACPACGGTANAMYWFWVKIARCPTCAQEIRLFKDYIFMEPRDRKGTEKTFVCPECHALFTTSVRKGEKQVVCNACGAMVPTRKGGPIRGQKYTCPSCHATQSFVDYIGTGHQFELVLYACEYYCPHCDTKGVKVPDSDDIVLVEKAEADYRALQSTLPVPSQEIPLGYNTQQVMKHGYQRFEDLFTPRQRLCLGLLYKAILEIEDPNLREFFVLTFSDSLEFNNLLCSYARAKHHLYNAFKSHILHPPLMPCESNTWGTKFGRGIFRLEVKHTHKGKTYSQKPYEMIPQANGSKKFPTTTPIDVPNLFQLQDPEGTSTGSQNEMIGDDTKEFGGVRADGVVLYCQDSSKLPLADRSVDFVVTDPPYFDNVMYSELADFYYVWLRLALAGDYAIFAPPITPKAPEIIKNRTRGLTSDHYGEGLKRVFQEAARVLRNDGVLVFSFHHKDFAAWEKVLGAVIDAGFGVTACHPVHAESKISAAIIYKKAVELDLLIVCRKRPLEYKIPAMTLDGLREAMAVLLDTNPDDPTRPLETVGDSMLNHYIVQLGRVISYLSWHVDPAESDTMITLLREIKQMSARDA